MTLKKENDKQPGEEEDLPTTNVLLGYRLELGDKHPHTLESWHNLIALYEAWNKPEQAEQWRARRPID